jgi:hypothetical protein
LSDVAESGGSILQEICYAHDPILFNIETHEITATEAREKQVAAPFGEDRT